MLCVFVKKRSVTHSTPPALSHFKGLLCTAQLHSLQHYCRIRHNPHNPSPLAFLEFILHYCTSNCRAECASRLHSLRRFTAFIHIHSTIVSWLIAQDHILSIFSSTTHRKAFVLTSQFISENPRTRRGQIHFEHNTCTPILLLFKYIFQHSYHE